MTEDFLHYVWKHRQFNLNDLKDEAGVQVVIKSVGNHNHSSGPDFAEARIGIDGIEWAGSVEIHLRSSDWIHHGHTGDSSYDNVILHVVYEHDKDILNQLDKPIPTLVLKGRIDPGLIKRFDKLRHNEADIACKCFLPEYSTLNMNAWLSRMAVERFERKVQDILLIHEASKGDWLQTFHALLAAYIGQQFNKLPMLELARRLPLSLLSKYEDDVEALSGMALGVGGFFGEVDGTHALASQRDRFEFLRTKHGLEEVTQAWKTGRVRPQNAPVRRVVQWSSMVPHLRDAYQAVLHGNAFNWSDVKLELDPFWGHHYGLNTPSKKPISMTISKQLSDVLSINAHAPFVFFYGHVTGQDEFKERGLDILSSVRPELNSITKKWTNLNVKAPSALQTQGLIELYTGRCTTKKCVTCNVGKAVLTNL